MAQFSRFNNDLTCSITLADELLHDGARSLRSGARHLEKHEECDMVARALLELAIVTAHELM